jgi:hypothetical protein
MYMIGYSDTWDEWTISEMPDNMLDSQCWSYSYKGRPATVDDVDVVTAYYYDNTHVEFGGTDYRFLTRRGLTLVEAFDVGYWYIKNYINEQDRQEDREYE